MLGSLFGGAVSAPTMLEIIFEIIKGLLTNFLITFLAVLVPLSFGIPLSLACKKSNAASKIFGWLRLPFEIICIPVFIFLLFYVPGFVFGTIGALSRELAVIFALMIAYLLYIPSRYNDSYSFLKNALLNSLGLISAIFKWSFVARIVAVDDLSVVATNFIFRGIIWPLMATFIIVAVILAVFEIPKATIKHFMK